MSAIDKQISDLAVLAFTKIGELAKGDLIKDAKLALEAISKIVAAVHAARARQISPADLKAVIEKADKAGVEQLAANKKTIQAEIDKKFPKSPT